MVMAQNPPAGAATNEASGWDVLERISKALSIAAIPVVLAFVGWIVQRRLQDQTLKRDYVQLAVSILKETDNTKVSPELRDWAVQLLNVYSPIKFGQLVTEKLISGEMHFPSMEKFTAVASADLTAERVDRYSKLLTDFQKYLHKAGFTIKQEGEIKVSIDKRDKNLKEGVMAYFDDNKKTIFVNSKYADETDVLLHAYMRHILPKENGNPENQTEWDKNPELWSYYALESAVAPYYVCSFNNRPTLGSGKNVIFDLSISKKNRKKVFDGQTAIIEGVPIWGSSFWELRNVLGADKADASLTKCWNTWELSTPVAHVTNSFIDKLIEIIRAENNQLAENAIDIFIRHGLRSKRG